MQFRMSIVICLLVYNVYGRVERRQLKCIAFDHTNGCSVPLRDIFFPYAAVFKNACDLHDICYDCGSQFGWMRKDCDNKFLLNMREICKHRKDQGVCEIKAKNYHRAVRWFGFWFYQWTSPKWCTIQSCVKVLGNPRGRT